MRAANIGIERKAIACAVARKVWHAVEVAPGGSLPVPRYGSRCSLPVLSGFDFVASFSEEALEDNIAL